MIDTDSLGTSVNCGRLTGRMKLPKLRGGFSSPARLSARRAPGELLLCPFAADADADADVDDS